MEFFKKVTAGDVLVKSIDSNGDYSIASKNDPEPDSYTRPTFHQQANKEDLYSVNGWQKITAEEASKILGYDVTE